MFSRDIENDKDAFRLANESRFDLVAALFTSDIEKGEKIASEKSNQDYVL